MRLLLAEDDAELGNWLTQALAQNGLHADWVMDGRLVRRRLKEARYDALILDLGLPGLDGHSVIAGLREAGERLPILVLTARDSLAERVATLRGGADDHLAKPFELAELEARLLALVRRARGGDRSRAACGPLTYDGAAKRFELSGQALPLTPREHALLRALIQRRGEPLSKREIAEQVFPGESDVQLEAVEVLVHRLRKRLERSPVRIATLRGLGYLLEEMPSPAA